MNIMKNIRPFLKLYCLVLSLGICNQISSTQAANKIESSVPELELNYGLNKRLDLQTRMQELELNTKGRPALKAVNRYETALGMSLKPAQWLKIRPEVRYQWTETNGAFDTDLSGRQVQFGINAEINF